MLLQDCWGEFLRMEQLFAQDRYLQRQAPVLSHPCVCRHEYEGYTRAHTRTHTQWNIITWPLERMKSCHLQ